MYTSTFTILEGFRKGIEFLSKMHGFPKAQVQMTEELQAVLAETQRYTWMPEESIDLYEQVYDLKSFHEIKRYYTLLSYKLDEPSETLNNPNELLHRIAYKTLLASRDAFSDCLFHQIGFTSFSKAYNRHVAIGKELSRKNISQQLKDSIPRILESDECSFRLAYFHSVMVKFYEYRVEETFNARMKIKLLLGFLLDQQNFLLIPTKLEPTKFAWTVQRPHAEEEDRLYHAIELVKRFLDMKLPIVEELLRVYKFFNKSADSIEEDFFGIPIGSELECLREEMKDLIPSEFCIIDEAFEAWGMTLATGDIGVCQDLFDDEREPSIVKIFFTIIHELTHRKKLFHQARFNPYFGVPDTLTPFYPRTKDPKERFSSGTFAEKRAFGGKILMDKITQDVAQKILYGDWDADLWKEVLEKITDKPTRKGAKPTIDGIIQPFPSYDSELFDQEEGNKLPMESSIEDQAEDYSLKGIGSPFKELHQKNKNKYLSGKYSCFPILRCATHTYGYGVGSN